MSNRVYGDDGESAANEIIAELEAQAAAKAPNPMTTKRMSGETEELLKRLAILSNPQGAIYTPYYYRSAIEDASKAIASLTSDLEAARGAALELAAVTALSVQRQYVDPRNGDIVKAGGTPQQIADAIRALKDQKP